MKRLIYTAVFGDYDRVYPPVRSETGVDYAIVTDRADMFVPGWETMVIDGSDFPTSTTANRYHKMLMHRVLPGYDASLYVDGNIRLLGDTAPLFEQLEHSKAALAAYAHPQRSRVAEEARTLIEIGKVQNTGRVKKEVSSYKADGFPDNTRLIEGGVILKNHRAPGLDAAMELWWNLFREHLTRDQLSLPYVIWKTGLSIHLLPGTFRDPNPFFAIYPHYRAKNVNPRYVHVAARSHDSAFFKLALTLWHGYWNVRRALRRRGQRFPKPNLPNQSARDYSVSPLETKGDHEG